MDLTAGKIAVDRPEGEGRLRPVGPDPALHHREPRGDRLAGRGRAAGAGQGRQLRDGQLRRRRLQGRRHDERQPRLHGVPGNHPRHPARRRSTDRHDPHSGRRQERRGREEVPGLSSPAPTRRPSERGGRPAAGQQELDRAAGRSVPVGGLRDAVARPMRWRSSSTATRRPKWRRPAWKASSSSWCSRTSSTRSSRGWSRCAARSTSKRPVSGRRPRRPDSPRTRPRRTTAAAEGARDVGLLESEPAAPGPLAVPCARACSCSRST